MTYYSATSGDDNMLWFMPKKSGEDKKSKEAEIQAIREETLATIKQTNKSIEKVNTVLDTKNDITLNIYYATGGDRRKARS